MSVRWSMAGRRGASWMGYSVRCGPFSLRPEARHRIAVALYGDPVQCAVPISGRSASS